MRGIYRDGYFKVSRRITESSLWSEATGDSIKVFLTLLALSQDPGGPRNGTVLIARKQLAAKCFLSIEALDAAIIELSNPDKESRTQRHSGRRVEVLPNGFRILNYGLYHDEAKDEATSKARAAAGRVGGKKSAELRKAQSDTSKQNGSKPEANSSNGDGDGDKTETETETEHGRYRPLFIREVFDHWRVVMGKAGKTVLDEKRRSKIAARLSEGYTVDDCRRAIEGCASSDFHMGRDRKANPKGTQHNDLTLILRSGSDLERFRDMAPDGAQPAASPGALFMDKSKAEVEAEVKALMEREAARR